MITKSNYVEFVSCPRALYYTKYNKDEAKELGDQAKKRIDEGNLVNEFAHKIFPNTVSVKKDPNCVDIKMQSEITKRLLKDNNPIAEASFIFEDLFCAVDILVKNEDNSYDIYEVKASTDVKKHLAEYYPDVAFQKYVLQQCGLKIRNCRLLHLNKEYVRQGELEPRRLLIDYPIEWDDAYQETYNLIPANLAELRKIVERKQEPDYGHCEKTCPYFEYCHRSLPKPNIIDINGIRINKAHQLIEEHIVTLEDVSKSSMKLNERQWIQVNCCIKPDKSSYTNNNNLSGFLNKLKYPIYHLDFETMNEAIPPFDGVGPYVQVPFQYSLHIEHTPGGKLEHKEFLATKLDSERELAEQLCRDIPMGATSMAYNMTFEKSVLRHLASRFPDLKDHLMDIHNNLVDLLVPFKQAYYYDAKQGGSNSIKYVMPALCPEMEEAYHNLPVVHNGGEALTMFPKMIAMPSGPEKDRIRKGMLEYCELDTLSMVKVLNKLWEKVK